MSASLEDLVFKLNNIQREFLELHASGFERQEIAGLLGVSAFTIEAIVNSIKKKLQVLYLFEAEAVYRQLRDREVLAGRNEPTRQKLN